MAFPTVPTVGAGRVLWQLATSPSGTHTSPSLTSLTKNAGDLLIAGIIIYDGNSTNAEFSAWGGGFTEFADQAGTATMGIGLAYKWSTGSETGTFTVTSADTSTNDSAFFLLSIPGANLTTPPEAGTMATGTAPDVGSFNPAGWGTEDTLWIMVGASGETATTGSYTGIAAPPANYTDESQSGISADAVGGVEGAVAFRQLNAASDDPAAYTMDTSNARGAAILIAVRPDLTQSISLDLLDAGPALYAPTLLNINTLVLGLIDASPAVYAPELTQVTPTQTITLDLLDASNALYAPTLAPQAVTVTLPFLDSRPAAGDSFSRTETEGWGIPESGSHNIVGPPTAWGDYDEAVYFDVASGVGTITVVNPPGIRLHSYTTETQVRTVEATVRVKVNDVSETWGIWVSPQNHGQDFGYAAALELAPSAITLDTRVDLTLLDGPVDLTSRLGVPVADAFYLIRVRVEDVGGVSNNIYAKAWKEGQTEPPAWDVTSSDDTYLDTGGFDLAVAFPNATGTFIVSFDDVQSIGDASDLGIYAPALQATNTITLGLLDASNALYAPTLIQDQFIELGLLDASNALYAPTITTVNTISLGLLDASPDVYAPALATVNTISLDLLDAGPDVYAPEVIQGGGTQSITLGLLDAAPDVYAPTLLATNTISLDLLDASPAVYAPTLLATNTLTLGLLDAGSALYAPELIQEQFIELGLLDASPALYAPTIVQEGGLQTIELGLLDAGPAVYAPDIVPAAITIGLALLDSGPAVYAPSFATSYTISLGLLDAGAALYAPTLTSLQIVELGLLDSGSALYEPYITRANDASPKKTTRPRPMRVPPPLIIDVTGTVTVVVPAPVVLARGDVNDDEIILEMLAEIL